MAANFPGPYQLRIAYAVASRQHTQRLNLQLVSDVTPGTPFTNISVQNKSGGNAGTLDVLMLAWMTLCKPLFDDTLASFTGGELWKYTAGTNDAIFISSRDEAVVGTDAGNVNTASQGVLTFRTTNGGILRLDFMDINIIEAVSDFPPFVNATVTAIANFVTGATNWLYARDNSYPASARGWFAGKNEALFKKVYRP